jgi:hypothetical protein
LRELRDMPLDDLELERLLKLTASDDYDSRENLLVHFVGWAIVFDLAREEPDASWRRWIDTFGAEAREVGTLAAAKARLESTLRTGSELEWLERLGSDDAGTRFATAKGLWKLRSTAVIDRLLDSLEREPHDSVRVACALNVLLATSETRLGRTRWNRVASVVFPTLREPKLGDETESSAARELYQSMRRWDSRRDRSSQDALQDLARFWEE